MQVEPVKLTLLRHGQSSFNEAGLYQGQSDLPVLTKKGQGEARLALAHLSGRYDRLWVSPLTRARETADILRRATALPAPETCAALSEIDLPEWEGRRFSEVKTSDHARHQCWKFTPSRFLMTHRDGSTHSPALEVLGRARDVLAWARALPAGQHVLAVSHSGLIRAALVAALELDIDHLHAMRIDNCAVTELALCADGTTHLRAFNRGATPPGWRDLTTAGRVQIMTDSATLANQACRTVLHAATAGHTVMHLSLADIARHLEETLGRAPEGKTGLWLRPGALHAVLPQGPSDPVRLWHLNLDLPGADTAKRSAAEETFA